MGLFDISYASYLQPRMKKLFCCLLAFGSICISSDAQPIENPFEQIDGWWPTPNSYRTASGAPGPAYWQQRVDYSMDIVLNDEERTLSGDEVITYYNQSPDKLTYLWVQLDQNIFSPESDSKKINTGGLDEKVSARQLLALSPEFHGGFNIDAVTDVAGKPLRHFINKTMMRIDLEKPLVPGEAFKFRLKWWHHINERAKVGGRSGYEFFEADSNNLYTIAQFFPRMCVYTDYAGWQNKQFLGKGEFTLNFGDYDVRLTVPADHIVAATGELQNAAEVLTPVQRQRLEQARRDTTQPVFIVTPDEALAAEKGRATATKTWRYKARNVRDFAFVSSRKFMWDAMAVPQKNSTVLAMSLYPKEGNPLWEKYSTKAVAQTLRTYSRMTFDYPYPYAISVHTDRIGMEYPMICFNGGRPEPDGTYSERTKYGMISVIIHEVGHNYFPMIVNSDERQWTWMDEGLNTFLQYLTEQEFERDYPSWRGEPAKIVDYMAGDPDGLEPIMSNSELIRQFGANAYAKPATGLNILRETIMGPELFDFAFREYANRWMFKHPTPADFFRTMEDASAVDLDWFWHGWFYTAKAIDLGIKSVTYKQLSSNNPETENALARQQREGKRLTISEQRNLERIPQTYNERDTSLNDFYTVYDPLDITESDRKAYEEFSAGLSDDEKALLAQEKHYYEIVFENVTGFPMPLIIELTYDNDSTEIREIPAEIWQLNNEEVTKVLVTDRPVVGFTLDPMSQTADINTANNSWPPTMQAPSRFELYKARQNRAKNPMQESRPSQN